MAGKHKLPSGVSDALFSPIHKKRRIVKQPKALEDTADTQHPQGSQPKAFTKADAEALYRQVEHFEQDFRMESSRVNINTSPRDVELHVTRATLHRRHRGIRDLLRHTFFTDLNHALQQPSPTYHTLTAHRAALTRHQALWHHRCARRRTLRAARALAVRTTALTAAEAAHDAASEPDPHDPSLSRVAFAQRKRWYRTVKRDMRRRGQWVSRAEPGPVEPVDVRGDPSARVRFFDPVAGDWILPAHVQDKWDLDVYLNQLGLRFTPVDD
ncbi:LOW QUALITY PROTEIN: hypothetical protein LZ30DRAFT_759679 [Colletotrichum cereale]|nr:LOW QUALITY PROTEIN: hypothetical protein LZ30DRAFT_759679 [Colletotrichum cereale]